jgi:iron(III) transport system permease protein
MSPKPPARNPAIIAALLFCAVVVGLPFVGIGLALLNPFGLIPAPPLEWARLLSTGWRSLTLALGVASACLLLGTFFAFVQVRWRFRGSNLLTRLTVLPLVLPSFLLAATLRESFAPLGPVGKILGFQGRFEGMLPALLVLILCCTPYVQLIVAAALRQLPAQSEEAARSLGASQRRVLLKVLFPGLRPALGFSALLVMVYALADFGAVAVLDARVLTFELYQFVGRGGIQAPLMGLLLCAFVIPLILIGRGLTGSGANLSQARKRCVEPCSPTLIQRLTALILIGSYLALALVLPTAMCLQMAFSGELTAPILRPLATTLMLGIVGGLLTLMLGGLPAALVTASKKSQRSWLELATFLASGVPGVLVAFGLLQLMLRLPSGNLRDFGEGGLLLLFGLAMRFSSHAYAALKPALLAESDSPIEAARSLGASPWRRFWSLRLPGLTPALMAGFLLSFIAIVKELPITIMLLPAGESSLATRIFDAHEDAHLADLGVSALTLIGMVLAAQALLRRWER